MIASLPMWSTLRRAVRTVLPLLLVLTASLAHAGETVIDMAGRRVTLPDHVERVLLGEGRLLYAMALLEGKDPLRRIVGWQGDLEALDPQTWATYRQAFPGIDRIPLIGKSSEATVSVEKALALKPDIAIFSVGGHGPSRHNALVQRFEAAGIPVVFVDFRQSPLKDTAPSIELMGKALHRESQAKAYLDFYRQHMDRVRTAVASVPAAEHPKVFIELLAGVWGGCCHTAGKGNLGELVQAAGGINIAADLLPGVIGDLNLEQVIASAPDVYVATGSRREGDRPALHIGAQTPADEARRSLDALLTRPGLTAIKAIREGHVHGLWHNYYDSPYNIVAIEAFVSWFYPGRFPDIDPAKTQAELYSRFLAVPPGGTYWIDGDKP